MIGHNNTQEQKAREMFASLLEATRIINQSAREQQLEALEDAITTRGKILKDASPVSNQLNPTERRELVTVIQELDYETQMLIAQQKEEIIHKLKDIDKQKLVLKYSK